MLITVIINKVRQDNLLFIDTVTSVDRHQLREIKTGIGIRFVKDSHRVGI